MDIGLNVRVRFLPEKPEPLEQAYRNNIDDAVIAEELGFDFIRTSEHHFAPDAWMPAQIPFLSFVAGRTSRVRLGTNVLLLPFHNPIRIAEDIATLDLMSGGRVDLACGVGSITDEFESFGLYHNDRWGRMFEGLEIIRRSFTEDAFDFKGRHFDFPNIRMTTKPLQSPFPLWVGATGPKTLARAAAAGYHMAGGSKDPSPFYEAAGRDPDEYNWSAHVNAHLAESKDKAWDEAEVALRHHRLFYADRDWISMPESQQGKSIPPLGEYRTHPENGVVGTPEDVLRQMEPRLKSSRMTHMGFAFRHAGMETEAVRRSMRMFAREVLPELKKWGRKPVSHA